MHLAREALGCSILTADEAQDMSDDLRNMTECQMRDGLASVLVSHERLRLEVQGLELLIAEDRNLKSMVGDLAMLVRRLCRQRVSDKTREQALDYIKRKGLEGSILRGE